MHFVLLCVLSDVFCFLTQLYYTFTKLVQGKELLKKKGGNESLVVLMLLLLLLLLLCSVVLCSISEATV